MFLTMKIKVYFKNIIISIFTMLFYSSLINKLY